MDKNQIIWAAIENSMSYSEYRQLVQDKFDAGKTTGMFSTQLLYYTELNLVRMKKWEKHFKPDVDTIKTIEAVTRDQIWLVISEGWCGDAAHALPIFDNLAERNDKISLKLVLRDENPELMDLFLTNGTRGIPKLIRLDKKTLEVLGSWGPRPSELDKLFRERQSEGVDMHILKKEIQIWYARNRGVQIEKDLLKELNSSL